MRPSQPAPPRSLAASILAAALGVALLVVVVRCAWVSDDAFVTLRTVDHLLGGRGLRFNALERVQAYTHPAWMVLLAGAYAITREPWLTSMAVGVGVSAGAVALLLRGAVGPWSAALALGALVASKAWVDFATSGLENPLTNLLLAAFALALFRPVPSSAALVGLAALLGTTRLDALLLVAPALGVVLGRKLYLGDRREVLAAQAGWAPLLAWHLFALVYYGDPLPNTAHAKLGAGLPLAETWPQGLAWWRWNLGVDPLTPAVTLLGLGAGVASRDVRALAFAAGAALYLGWVTEIGGDFMAGRFLVAPLVVALLLATRRPWGRAGGAIGLALVGASLLLPHAPLRSGPAYARAKAADGVVDERGYYWRGTGLFAEGREGWAPTHEFVRDGRAAPGRVSVKTVVGLYAFYAGPDHHVVDRVGLADPLLARLPAIDDPEWRIGHHRRVVPPDYPAAALAGRPVKDPALRVLHEDVLLAARGDLFDPERWAALGRLIRGVDLPEDLDPYRYPELRDLAGPPSAPVPTKPTGIRFVATEAVTLDLRGGRWHVRVTDQGRTSASILASGRHTLGPGAVILLPEGDDAVVEPAP